MAFTYLREHGVMVPAMVCDICSSRVGADGFVLGGLPIRTIREGVEVVSVAEDGPASVFTACSEGCRDQIMTVHSADVTGSTPIAAYLMNLVQDLDA